jgi:hypothetical protein
MSSWRNDIKSLVKKCPLALYFFPKCRIGVEWLTVQSSRSPLGAVVMSTRSVQKYLNLLVHNIIPSYRHLFCNPITSLFIRSTIARDKLIAPGVSWAGHAGQLTFRHSICTLAYWYHLGNHHIIYCHCHGDAWRKKPMVLVTGRYVIILESFSTRIARGRGFSWICDEVFTDTDRTCVKWLGYFW